METHSERERGIGVLGQIQGYRKGNDLKSSVSRGWADVKHCYFLGIRFAESAMTAHNKKSVANTVNPEL